MKAIIITLLITLLAQTSWPVSMVLSKYNLISDQNSIFIAGVVCLILSALGPVLVLRYHISNVDPLMYVLSVFAWTCMIDLGIGLELDGYIKDFIGYYFAEGEPYLKSGYGTAINYWDGTTQFVLCLAIIGLYAARKSHREVGLFWAGSIINSLIVLVPGGITGNYPFKMSILLNVPYFLLPVLSVFKFFNERPPQSRSFYKANERLLTFTPGSYNAKEVWWREWKDDERKGGDVIMSVGDKLPGFDRATRSQWFKSILQRPLDMLFILYFVAALGLSAFRGLAASGGNADAMKSYIKNIEPYIAHPSNFSRIQMFVYEYCFSAYYMAAIYGLIYPGKHWMADWALLHGGAAAQSQFSYMKGSVHHLTSKAFQNPVSGSHGLICWAINTALFVVPLLFAVYSLTDVEKFGRTYNVDRAEVKESQRPMSKKKKSVKKSD